MSSNSESGSAFASFEDATQYLEKMCRVFNVRHLSYWSVSMAEGLPDQVTWIATYDPAYMNHYMANHTPVGDPAFDSDAVATPGVIDWMDSSTKDPAIQSIYQAAVKFGIAKQGLSYHFRDGADRSIMFSVNVDCEDADWPAEKERIVGSFRNFAHYFHAHAKPLVESRRMTEASSAA